MSWWQCGCVTCTKDFFYVKVRINFSVSEHFLRHFPRVCVTHFEILVWRLTAAFCSLFCVEATPLARVHTPLATFCPSWFLGMWPLFSLQWAVEGTWKETDRLGRFAWKVGCICAAHTATKFKLKDNNRICVSSTRTLAPESFQRCYIDIGNVNAQVTEMVFRNSCGFGTESKKCSAEGSRHFWTVITVVPKLSGTTDALQRLTNSLDPLPKVISILRSPLPRCYPW